jgi:hypothetical protein
LKKEDIMKIKFYILLFLLFPIFAFSQFSSDLLVYNPYGDAFTLSLGGQIVNRVATNKVRVNDLQPGNYIVTITFSNYSIPSITQNIFVQQNSETSIALAKNIAGIYSLAVSIPIDYTQTNFVPDVHPMPPTPSPQPPTPQPNNGGCQFPMDDASFSSALSTISNQSFDDKKLTIARQIAAVNCLTSAQVKQIMEEFSFEDNRLNFAKYAYLHTYDPNNYFIVNDAFDFSSSVTELNNYIASQH